MLPNRIASAADESSRRKILIVLYRLKNIVMDALERRSRTHLAQSSVLQRVEGLNPAPHIHEQMTTSNYGYDIAYNFTHNNIMLEPNAMNNMNTVAHMDVHNTQY